MVTLLLLNIYSEGYTVSLDDASRMDRRGHMADSLHYSRLAIDINLFLDGEYLDDTEDHRPFGEYWKSIGGSWGGEFNDGNHYSLSYQGRR